MSLEVYLRNLDCISYLFFVGGGGRVGVSCLVVYVMLLVLHLQEEYHNIPRFMTIRAALARGGYFK